MVKKAPIDGDDWGMVSGIVVPTKMWTSLRKSQRIAG